MFFETYGPYILLGVFLFYLIGMNIYRTKKYNTQARELIEGLKKGDYVKTYSGLFGTIVKIEEQTLSSGRIEKTITLELSQGVEVKMDINAVYMLASELKPKAAKTTPAKTTKTTTSKKD